MTSTIIVTGAAGGLGLAIAETILARPESYNCLFTVRNKDAPRGKQLQHLIVSSGNNHKASTPEMDLGHLDSIREFASDVNAKVSSGKLPPIKALILNAAFFMEKGNLQFTQDNNGGKGFEMHFAVNYLANFLLTILLLESMDKEHGAHCVCVKLEARRFLASKSRAQAREAQVGPRGTRTPQGTSKRRGRGSGCDEAIWPLEAQSSYVYVSVI